MGRVIIAPDVTSPYPPLLFSPNTPICNSDKSVACLKI